MNPAYPGLAAAAFYLIGAFTQIHDLCARTTPVPRRRLLWLTTPAVVLHALTVISRIAFSPTASTSGVIRQSRR